MINENGKISPAPWVPYTRAGCDVGAVATANTVLENTAIDIPTVFGAGSDEAQEVIANPGQAFADFVGIGVHCAQGSSVCGASTHARALSWERCAAATYGLSGEVNRTRQSEAISA